MTLIWPISRSSCVDAGGDAGSLLDVRIQNAAPPGRDGRSCAHRLPLATELGFPLHDGWLMQSLRLTGLRPLDQLGSRPRHQPMPWAKVAGPAMSKRTAMLARLGTPIRSQGVGRGILRESVFADRSMPLSLLLTRGVIRLRRLLQLRATRRLWLRRCPSPPATSPRPWSRTVRPGHTRTPERPPEARRAPRCRETPVW